MTPEYEYAVQVTWPDGTVETPPGAVASGGGGDRRPR